MATPAEFLASYHQMLVGMDDWSMQSVRLGKYVNGADGATWGARAPLLEGVAQELNRAGHPGSRHAHTAWNLPSQFSIEGINLTKGGLLRVYMGKGSPDEIKDVLWLAHRYGLITNPDRPRRDAKSLQQYADSYIGLDCNGFTGNFFGLNPETDISRYAQRGQRRRDVSEIQRGDVLISILNQSRIHEHIGLVGDVSSAGPPTVFTIVEWGTDGQANHQKKVTHTFQRDGEGFLYLDYVSQRPKYLGQAGRKYVFSPPCTPIHRGYQIQA